MSSTVRLVFGVAGSAAEARTDREALASWIEEHCGVALTTKPAARYEDLVASVRDGSSDVAWLPPVVYARLAEGVTPIGCIEREGKTSYSSALVVDASSRFRTLDDLRGARAGWVDPWSAAGFVVPRLELTKAGLDPRRMFTTERFFGGHREALAALAEGACDVVATFARPADDELRTIATYGPIPSDVIAVRRNLDPARHERVVEAFRKAGKEGRAVMRAVFGGESLREGVEPGHEALRLAYERAVARGLFD